MCSEFLGAGTETVAAALQWIMANLVKRPHMQEAVRREIDAAVDAGAEEVGEEVLGKLDYLNAVVMEVLRLYPTATLVLRQVSGQDNIIHDGQRIPTGTNVVFPLKSLAQDKAAWVDPDEFKPVPSRQRWRKRKSCCCRRKRWGDQDDTVWCRPKGVPRHGHRHAPHGIFHCQHCEGV